MVTAISHRGGDGCAVYAEGPIAFGHTMCHTTMESLREVMPHWRESAGLLITADARIDNREDLISSLGIQPKDVPDSTLILEAYQKWGEDCVSHLLGDFAFGIWDARRRTLFCGRDPFGLKPLYYAFRDGVAFAFASEVKALLSLAWPSAAINENRIADYLALIDDDREQTFYQNIYRLPAAHTLAVNARSRLLRRFWLPEPGPLLRLKSDLEYAEAFRHVFTEAVRCRLRSAFPVGSALSGGLDSSSITCVARNLMQESGAGPLRTFSAVFPSLPAPLRARTDERRYMDSVLATSGLEPSWVEADRIGPLHALDRVLHHAEEPLMAPNLYVHWAMFSEARSRGIRIFLDGIDGDTTVGEGLDWLAELTRSFRWLRAYREAKSFAAMSGESSTGRILWDYALRPLVPPVAVAAGRRLRGRPSKPPTPRVIDPAFAATSGIDARVSKISMSAFRTERCRHAENLNAPLFQTGMEMCDKAAAAFGIESRYPFFDKRLVDFCLSVPSNQKLSKGSTRSIFRQAMSGILPEDVRTRRGKSDMSPGFTCGLARHHNLLLEQVLTNRTSAALRYVNRSYLITSYKRYTKDPAKFPVEAVVLYGFANLSRWMESVIG